MTEETAPVPLWMTLANAAILATPDEQQAIRALMRGASEILSRRFGAVGAARIVREIALDAEAQVIGSGGIVFTKH